MQEKHQRITDGNARDMLTRSYFGKERNKEPNIADTEKRQSWNIGGPEVP
jgi:hypothetical protein